MWSTAVQLQQEVETGRVVMRVDVAARTDAIAWEQLKLYCKEIEELLKSLPWLAGNANLLWTGIGRLNSRSGVGSAVEAVATRIHVRRKRI